MRDWKKVDGLPLLENLEPIETVYIDAHNEVN